MQTSTTASRSAHPALPPHPLSSYGRQWYAAAIPCVLLGVLAASLSLWLGAAGALACGAVCVAFGWVAGREGARAHRATHALLAYRFGDVDRAEAILTEAPPGARAPTAADGAAVELRAAIALYRGDLEEAERLATLAVEIHPDRFTSCHEGAWRSEVLALRALARAALGRDEEARADAATAEGRADASAVAVARTVLARAVVSARLGDYPGLATQLRTGNDILSALTSRERSLARALRRMGSRAPQGVYRDVARFSTVDVDPRLAAWIAKVVPGAETYAGEAALARAGLRPLAPLPGVVGMEARQKLAPRNGYKAAMLWIVLLGAFLGFWSLVAPGLSRVTWASTWSPGLVMASLYFAYIVFAVVRVLFRAHWQIPRASARLRAAQRDVLLGRASVSEALGRLARSGLWSIAAGAQLLLASLAWRRGDWTATLALADQGIARASRTPAVRAASGEILLPALIHERALALAARGDREQAFLDLALLAADFPDYPLSADAAFSVRLVAAARAGNLEEAASIAATRTPDLPLDKREELLVDLVVAAHGGVPAEEKARIEGDLREDDGLRAWVDALAPGLRAKMQVGPDQG